MSQEIRLEAERILHAVKNDTFHRNPKRKRGQKLRPSLTLRVTVRVNRVQYTILCRAAPGGCYADHPVWFSVTSVVVLAVWRDVP